MEKKEGADVVEKSDRSERSCSGFAPRVLVAVGIALFLILCLFLLYCTIRVLLLIFFSILISVFLRGISNWVTGWSKLPDWLSLTAVILVLCVLIGFSGWMLTPHVSEQINKLGEELPRSLHQAQSFVETYTGRIQGLKQDRLSRLIEEVGGLKHLGRFFSLTLQTVVDGVIVFFLVLYLAFSPELYVRGMVSLVPIRQRSAAHDIIQTLGSTLQWWLIGRFSAMAIVGVLSGIGLWLLGIPLALTLGVLAGLLTFIPYVGAIVSALPAILMALLVDFSHALYVVVLYVVIHIVEGYIFSPLIQERTVFIPPMVMLSALTAMTILLGVPGLIMATPLTAIVLVLVKKIYIEGILGDTARVWGRGTGKSD